MDRQTNEYRQTEGQMWTFFKIYSVSLSQQEIQIIFYFFRSSREKITNIYTKQSLLMNKFFNEILCDSFGTYAREQDVRSCKQKWEVKKSGRKNTVISRDI